jgi:hypothetical protein
MHEKIPFILFHFFVSLGTSIYKRDDIFMYYRIPLSLPLAKGEIIEILFFKNLKNLSYYFNECMCIYCYVYRIKDCTLSKKLSATCAPSVSMASVINVSLDFGSEDPPNLDLSSFGRSFSLPLGHVIQMVLSE